MKYLVFETEQEAIQAESAISEFMGFSKLGINAATGLIDHDVLTVKWAEPQQIKDGRWVIPSPDDNGEEAGDWWETNIQDEMIVIHSKKEL